MNRTILERDLKAVGVSLNGWMPLLRCDTCNYRWEPFHAVVGSTVPIARLDYWRCPNGCNATAEVSRSIQIALPRYININDIPGMVFGEKDAEEFGRFVRSMDLTEIADKREG